MPLVIQLTDDEKALWKGIDINESRRLAREVCVGMSVRTCVNVCFVHTFTCVCACVCALVHCV